MRIDVYAAFNHVLDKDIRDRTVIVVDTLRATSSVVTAMGNGCREVIPVADVNDAINVSHTMGSHTLLGGERDSNRIAGFDLGNSPLEYTRDKVEGKAVVMTTTNGTEAMLRTRTCFKALIGAMINDHAVAKAAYELGRDVTILCAGNNRKLSLEDILTAGSIISVMQELAKADGTELDMDDLGYLSVMFFQQNKDNLKNALVGCEHYKKLVKNGYDQDVEYCCKRNLLQIVPVFADGVVSMKNEA